MAARNGMAAASTKAWHQQIAKQRGVISGAKIRKRRQHGSQRQAAIVAKEKSIKINEKLK